VESSQCRPVTPAAFHGAKKLIYYYFIVAHTYPAQLARLIRALTYDGEEFFVHIDFSST
jgi:hypothetical protein